MTDVWRFGTWTKYRIEELVKQVRFVAAIRNEASTIAEKTEGQLIQCTRFDIRPEPLRVFEDASF